jgi:nitrite reductase/ring-hydroxylating ferredoxin subunit
MFVRVAHKDDIAPGGMKGYEVRGSEITVCNDGGRYYAVSRRCGHMNAPIDKGTLVGYIITCPMHYSQFDVKSGRLLSGPMLHGYAENYKLPEGLSSFSRRMGGLMADLTRCSNMKSFLLKRMAGLMAHITTCNLKTFKVKVEDGNILVDL